MIHGGKPLKFDRRDRQFDHHAHFGAPSLSQLPPNGLGRVPKYVCDQKYTSWCTGAGTSRASAYIEGKDMSFEYQAALIAYLSKEKVLTDGADPRKAMKATIWYGSLEKTLAPLTLEKDGMDSGDLSKYQDPLLLESAKNEKESYFWVHTGPNDAFDNIRMNLWKADQDAIAEAKRTGQPKKEYIVMAMSQWFPEWNGWTPNPDGRGGTLNVVPYIATYVPPRPVAGIHPILNTIITFFRGIFPQLFGGENWHFYNYIDYMVIDGVEYLVSQNSYGLGYAKGGIQLFPREVINATYADYRAGCAIFRDVDPKNGQSLSAQQVSIAQP